MNETLQEAMKIVKLKGHSENTVDDRHRLLRHGDSRSAHDDHRYTHQCATLRSRLHIFCRSRCRKDDARFKRHDLRECLFPGAGFPRHASYCSQQHGQR